ncbi:MAG: hypothetical protein LBE09_07475 [Christensenellaceae bacterium]|jgi:polygalacturonase|nr:hypothetical protein [Christensenellaceae bacterium]
MLKSMKINLRTRLRARFTVLLFALLLLLLNMALLACVDNGFNFNIPDTPAYASDKVVYATRLTTYDGPSIMQSSDDLSVRVEGKDLFVYQTRVNIRRSFSFSEPATTAYMVYFDFEGSVSVSITIPMAKEISSITIRPLAYKIDSIVTQSKIIFKLDYPASYTLEYKWSDGAAEHDDVLHIFANEIDINAINSANVPDDVIYVGPGIYDISSFPIESGKTLYIAGGAYVFGQIRAEFSDNITIRGRGIIDGSIAENSSAIQSISTIEFVDSTNITISGVILLDPAGCAVSLTRCKNSNISDVKIITARAYGRGISLQSCQNILVADSFVRSWDDSLVVKSIRGMPSSNIVFENCVVWTDLQHSCSIGYQTDCEYIQNITFRDITILHNYSMASLAIHNSDSAKISNIYFLNITIEDTIPIGQFVDDNSDNYIIDITIAKNFEWSVSATRGSIADVTLSNINILSTSAEASICLKGENSISSVGSVVFNNVYYQGKLLTSLGDAKFSTNSFVSSIQFGKQGNYTNGSRIKYPYRLAIRNSSVQYTNYSTPTQAGVDVASFAKTTIETPFVGDQITLNNISVGVTHNAGFDHTIYDDGLWSQNTFNTSNLFDNDASTEWVAPIWNDTKNEYAALSISFGDNIIKAGIIRLLFGPDSKYLTEYRIRLYNKSDAEKNFVFLKEVYCKASPSTGNYFDIIVPSVGSHTLQLRIYRNTGILGATRLKIGDIALYQISLSTNRNVYDVSSSLDIYTSDYLTDGNINTYWQALDEEAIFAIKLSEQSSVYQLHDIVLYLPPSLTWKLREEIIDILWSTDGFTYYSLQNKITCTFDPLNGNYVRISLSGVRASHILLHFYDNSLEGYGAQLSEIFIYGNADET